jgi:hypothetical protein
MPCYRASKLGTAWLNTPGCDGAAAGLRRGRFCGTHAGAVVVRVILVSQVSKPGDMGRPGSIYLRAKDDSRFPSGMTERKARATQISFRSDRKKSGGGSGFQRGHGDQGYAGVEAAVTPANRPAAARSRARDPDLLLTLLPPARPHPHAAIPRNRACRYFTRYPLTNLDLHHRLVGASRCRAGPGLRALLGLTGRAARSWDTAAECKTGVF